MKKQNQKELKQFSIIVGIGIPIIFGIIVPAVSGHSQSFIPFILGVVLLLIGIINPSKLNTIYKFWMWIGKCLGWVNSRIILSLVFILIVIPTSIIMKIFRYDPLRKRNSKRKSYRELKPNQSVSFDKIY